MTIGIKPYPAYKDSGMPWLGQVPEGWGILPNRALFGEVIERDHSDEQMLSVTITRGVICQQALLENSSKKDSSNQDKSAYKLVRPGDIAYNKMRAWQGAIGISDLRGIVSPAYVVEHLRHVNNPRYFHYLFRTPQFSKEAERWSYGITSDMWSLRPEHFRMIGCSLPPLPEQVSIVRYLDHADRKVRHAIRARQQLIKLLTEQKQAIIQHAVTRGLDPNVPLKPSGVPWLGDVPEHWGIRRLKSVMSFTGGGTPSKAELSYWTGDIPWVSPKDMKSDTIADSQDHITQRAVTQSSTKLVPAGSILMVVRSGILQRTIPIASCTRDVALNQDMKALTPKGQIDSQYFIRLVRGCEKALLTEWTKQGATVESIEHEFLANSRIPVPPLSEQHAIVQYVDATTATLDKAIDAAHREIDLLREYRTRLIADVVTGKLDVRDVPVPADETDVLPEDVETIDDVDAADQGDDAVETDSSAEESA